MVLYNSNLMKYRPHIIGMSVLLLAVHTLFEELISKNKSHKEILKAQEKEIVLLFIFSLFKLFCIKRAKEFTL